VISLVVVILNEFVASSLDIGSCFERFEVELIVLDGSEKPLNNHVVNGPALAVHRNLNALALHERNIFI
jgi:hypothetical protein